MALRSFEKQRYVGVTFWGTLATATRPTGMALIPAFLIVAWKERRPAIAYAASLAVGGGLLLFSLYCAFEFGDPLAFVQAQRKWRPSLGFDWLSWLKMLMQITVGPTNWKYGWIKDPLYPLLFSIILGCGFLLWRSRSKLGFVKVGDGFFVLGVLLWFLAGDPWIKAVTIFGGSYVLWRLRHSLSPVTVAFGFCALGLILASGSTISLNRLIYGIVSFSIAIGVLLERYPRWGYATLGFFTILLASFAVRFAQHQWVA
jgi:Gpi18-like mannosyltransferase